MNRRGFTLIELIIYILVFSLGVTVILMLLPQILASGSNSTIRLRGVQVAQAVMEEILAKKWDENTPNGGGPVTLPLLPSPPGALGPENPPENTMAKYNDVDDYHGISAMDSATGFGLTADYSIDVDVSYVSLTAGNTFITAGGIDVYKQIRVTVHSGTLNEDYELLAVKGDF